MPTKRRHTRLDALDRQILSTLMTRGRITWAQLADEVGLSAPSTTDRVHKLEELGLLEGYFAKVEPESVGCGLLAYVSVGLASPEHHANLVRWVEASPAVQECHIIAGDYDYLLKVRCPDPAGLERLLREELRTLPGITRTHSTIVMATAKETLAVPLPSEDND